MIFHETVPVLFPDMTVVVAATGPSLNDIDPKLARKADAVVVVSDAYRYIPDADVLYSCDAQWWRYHKGAYDFAGRRFSSHESRVNEKIATAHEYKLELVHGRSGYNLGFSFDQRYIFYGSNSGFQAVNLAILFGACTVVLIGFDMQRTKGMSHNFGDHQFPNNGGDPQKFIPHFNRAAKFFDEKNWYVEIINASVHTALDCFKRIPLEEALAYADTRKVEKVRKVYARAQQTPENLASAA